MSRGVLSAMRRARLRSLDIGLFWSNGSLEQLQGYRYFKV